MGNRSDLERLAPQLARAAQEKLDEWEQDENGFDEVLGHGGACGALAEAMCSVLDENGFLCSSIGTDFDGGHEFVVALCDEGVFSVDIPASVYEFGAGYVWEKREGVVLRDEDVVLILVREGMTEPEFMSEYLDEPCREIPGP